MASHRDGLLAEGCGLPDFILLDELTEQALYDNMLKRYDSDIIYTYIGSVVVSINPYKKIDKYYDDTAMKQYEHKYPYENPPHVYSLADTAYRQLTSNKHNQAIIISGESGAGKTEASKIVMRYIAAVTPTSKSKDMDRIKDMLLDSNPVLEAFGNAKTLRNDNSSRFGKYMQIQFNGAGFPVGGTITVYLLEKSRVVTRAMGERAFHCFYFLLRGAEPGLLSQLKLQSDPKAYRYLNQSECVDVSTVNDKQEFKIMHQAMKVLQFSDEFQLTIWKVLSAILHLGEVEFKAAGDGKCTVSNRDAVSIAAEMLGVKPDRLGPALVHHTISAGGKNIAKTLDVAGAIYARDALCKALYERMFLHIVEEINRVLSHKEQSDEVRIGLLDIYGFEVFEKNSFEQFCINLTNEKLQQVFIELTLKQEQEEYIREGIEWTPVEYFDNKTICDLIEAKPKGIIAFLDESCNLANRTDLDFLKKLEDNFAQHAHFETMRTKKDRTIKDDEFRLKHYAGDVHYCVDGMIDKNRDQLYRDLIGAMASASNDIVKGLFPDDPNSKKRPESAGTQFRRAVNELIDSLMKCEPHYIRCIKPNDDKRSNFMHQERTRHQIRYLGLLENVRVRRAGFAFRTDFKRFLERYKIIDKGTWPKWSGSDKDGTAHLLKSQGVDSSIYRLGKTKVFLKEPKTLFMFEEKRTETLPKIVNLLQRQTRGALARKAYRSLRATVIVQKYFRAWEARVQWAKKKATMTLQKNFFGALAKRWFLTEVEPKYGDVEHHPKLGKGIHLQQPSETLMPAYELIKDAARWWRMHKLVSRLTPPEMLEMRAKVATYDVFHNKKPYDPSMRYTTTNYVDLPSTDLQRKALFERNARGLYRSGDSQLLFVTDVMKVHHTGKVEARTLIVSENHLFKVDYKNFKLHKHPVPLTSVTGLALSSFADTVLVIQCEPPQRDIVIATNASCERLKFEITCQDDRLHQLVMCIRNQVAALKGGAAPTISFVDNSITFNNTRTDKNIDAPSSTITFTQDASASGDWPKTKWVVGKKNQHTVLYPARNDALVAPGSFDFEPMSPRVGRTSRRLQKSGSRRGGQGGKGSWIKKSGSTRRSQVHENSGHHHHQHHR